VTPFLFDQVVEFTLRHEGGLTQDPLDPGGLTNFGISQRAFPDLDVAALTREEAIEIYRAHYWRPLRCDELPAQVAILLFECGVNQGVPTATRLLQLAVGVRADGRIGPATLEAVRRHPHDDLAAELCARRALEYAKLPPFRLDRYGFGWMRRLMECYRFALVHG